MQSRTPLYGLLLAITFASPAVAAETRPLEFEVTFTPAVSPTPFSGRVYVTASQSKRGEAPSDVNWFKPDPFFAWDVKDWRPGQPLVLGNDAVSFPGPLAKLAKGNYAVQAVMDFDRGERSFARAPGNGYSKPVRLDLDPQAGGRFKLTIDQTVPPPTHKDTAKVKFVETDSKLLTDFHHRPIKMRAGVVLPRSFDQEPKRRYPVVYEIPGFGGRHTMALLAGLRNATQVGGAEMVYVVLDPECRTGHHVFADSENNGPWGRALTEEFIPFLETRFRGLGHPWARFVTGHSSGGWSSLWLQVAYPDFFGGVWSTAPDPVDFRDFQRIDVYKPGVNMFSDEAGQPRPIARRAGKPVLYYKGFSDMEEVMGHGGQLASFEAVFSPRGPDGQPRKLWDRRTGRVEPEVARAWQRYDIRLILEGRRETLGPKLAGKLHVFVGGQDTFYLEGAVALLKQSLSRFYPTAVVETVPGKDHGSLVDSALRTRIAKEMEQQFRQGLAAHQAAQKE